MENKAWKDNNTLAKLKEDFEHDKKEYQYVKDRYYAKSQRAADAQEAAKNERVEFLNTLLADLNKFGTPNKWSKTLRQLDEWDIMHILEASPEERLEKIVYKLTGYSVKDIQETLNEYNKAKELSDEIQKVLDNGNIEKYKQLAKKSNSIWRSDKKWDKPGQQPWNYAAKAKDSWQKENPYKVGGSALWHSKNGDREVTVLTIDEPNKRAKINTDKGAIMYVPLDALEPKFDDQLLEN